MNQVVNLGQAVILATNSAGSSGVSWGAIASNTVTDIIFMLMFSGVLILWFVVFSYLLSGMESLTVYNPAMAFFIFVIAIAIAFNADTIVNMAIEKAMGGGLSSAATTGHSTIFSYLFGKDLGAGVILPLIRVVGYWVMILSPLIIALPNGVAAMNELARFQIGRLNAAGAITALATATIFLIGLPTFHGKINDLVKTIPDLMNAIEQMMRS